jgi:hypothetical protein
MLTTTSSSRTSSVQWLIESRPPSLTWARPSPQQSNQPPLDLIDQEFDHADDTAANHRGVRVSTVKARWAARPRPGLPDAQEWSTTLALAVIQALVGRRPVAHPNRSKRALACTGSLRRRGPRLRHPVLGQPCVRLSAGGATNLGQGATILRWVTRIELAPSAWKTKSEGLWLGGFLTCKEKADPE